MRHTFSVPPRLSPGDRVAVVSPSWAAPGAFPHVHELAMRRLRDDIGLVPVEYPTTRQLGAHARDRARDLMAAYADRDIRAVMASIGGDDQITVLPFLDPDVVRADPKPFFGYSDNTNILNWLWNLGVPGYHGGSTMVHLGRPLALHPVSVGSLRAALFGQGSVEMHAVDSFSEDELPWDSPGALDTEPASQPGGQWTWYQPNSVVSGPTWGGNLEILHWNLAAGRWIRPVEDYEGCVLLLETSEELPSAVDVSRMLRNAGERGLLAQFPAVIVGRPKAASLERQVSADERERYRKDQAEAVLSAFGKYGPDAMIVLGVDIGHTDPQWVVPYGGAITVDGPARRLTIPY